MTQTPLKKKTRFPLSIALRYRVLSDSERSPGWAMSVGISSDRLWMEVDESFAVGDRLEISMLWPVLLEGRTPLELRIRGTVRELAGRIGAISIEAHEYRTAAKEEE